MNRKFTFSLWEKTALLIVLNLWTYGAFSQKNYSPGMAIDMSGDTLRGEIDYQNWKSNPETINFRAGAVEKVFSVADLSEFAVSGERYVKASVQVDTSNQGASISSGKEQFFEQKAVFLRELVSGPKSLYTLTDRYFRINYYIGENSGYTRLTYLRYWDDNNLKRQVISKPLYKQQLAVYFNDCPAASRSAMAAIYSKKAILSVFERYYSACSDRKPVTVASSNDEKLFEWGIMVGASASKINFKGSTMPYLTAVDYPASINPTGGISLDFVVPRTKRQWRIHNELIYSQLNTKGSFVEFKSENDNTTRNLTFKYGYLKLNNLVRFQKKVGGLEWFLNGGVSNSIVVKGDQEMISEVRFYTSTRVLKGTALDGPKKHELGLLAGVGTVFRAFSIEARYESGSGMSPYVNIKSRINRGYLFIGYRF